MNIKNLRKSKKITQQQLAKMVGLSQQHVSKIENFLIIPNYATMNKIANALGYDIVWKERSDNGTNKENN